MTAKQLDYRKKKLQLSNMLNISKTELILRCITGFCVLYVVVTLIGFGLSLSLPSFHDFSSMEARQDVCYWTNALVGYVECGDGIPGGSLREFVYNFWAYFFYAPMFVFSGNYPAALVAIIATVILYGPIAFLGVLWFRYRRYRKRHCAE